MGSYELFTETSLWIGFTLSFLSISVFNDGVDGVDGISPVDCVDGVSPLSGIFVSVVVFVGIFVSVLLPLEPTDPLSPTSEVLFFYLLPWPLWVNPLSIIVLLISLNLESTGS